MTSKSDIKLTKISKSFTAGKEKVKVLDDLDLEIKKGELSCIIGPNGSGKTTLVKIIAGIEKPTSGSYDQPNNLAYLPQQGSLMPWFTVRQNIELPGRINNKLSPDINARLRKYLKKYGLTKFADFYPDEISGGMKQKVALIRAVVYRPGVIILDEPFSALDAITRIEMRQMLVDLWREYNPTILCVTHDIDEAIYLSDRIFVIKGLPGEIAATLNVKTPRPRTLDSISSDQSLKIKKTLHRMLLK